MSPEPISIQDAAEQVYEAVANEGSHPKSHKWILHKHRKEWPTLWRALDALFEVLEREAAL